jgi:hypothetical protein
MKMAINMEEKMSPAEDKVSELNGIYTIGGRAALGAVVVGLLEIIITFLPGGNVSHDTVLDWFRLFQENWFMGLRDLGLLNIILNALAVPIFFALYVAHKKDRHQPYAALAVIIAFVGIGVFYATNRAFAMFDLSNRYAASTTDAQRALLEAAGQALLSVGQSHTPGTFLGFMLVEAAGIIMSIVMLQSKIFSQISAYAGILGFGCLVVFEFLASFVSGLSQAAMILAMFGGLLSMAWYILIAGKLFKLGKNNDL